MHNTFDRGVFMNSGSFGICMLNQGSMRGMTQEAVYAGDADTIIHMDHVIMPTAATRSGGAGTIVDGSIGGVGYGCVHVRENDTGPDDCNHAQFGAFVLAGPGVPARGELEGAHLLDVAPTLLALGGYDIPDEMQGRNLLGDGGEAPLGPGLSPTDEETIRRRLSGLGYIS
jgi:hypothetical protein